MSRGVTADAGHIGVLGSGAYSTVNSQQKKVLIHQSNVIPKHIIHIIKTHLKN